MISIHLLNRCSNIRDKSMRIICFNQLLRLKGLEIATFVRLTGRDKDLLTSNGINRPTFIGKPSLTLKHILPRRSPSDQGSRTLDLALLINPLVLLLES